MDDKSRVQGSLANLLRLDGDHPGRAVLPNPDFIRDTGSSWFWVLVASMFLNSIASTRYLAIRYALYTSDIYGHLIAVADTAVCTDSCTGAFSSRHSEWEQFRALRFLPTHSIVSLVHLL